MEPEKLFINSAGRMRSGWRLIVFLLAFILLLFLIGSAVRVAYVAKEIVAPGLSLGFYVQDVVYRLMILTSSLGAGYLCAHWLEGLPWRSLGLSLHTGWFRHFMVGSAIGIVSLALAAAVATGGGGLRFTFSTAGIFPHVASTLALSGGLFVVAALTEEALFRAYPLQTFTRAALVPFGVAVTSLTFAGIHMRNPNFETGLAFGNLFLAGVWLAVAYLRTRSLWFPLGVHWAWNWALGSLFGLPVSGITRIAPHPLFQGTDLGPSWLTGGVYGIEGGVACTIALVISTIFIWRTPWVSATEEMKRLTSQENPAETNVVVSPVPQNREVAAE
jgi:uncharacterized protein